jgi:hypothetical protein
MRHPTSGPTLVAKADLDPACAAARATKPRQARHQRSLPPQHSRQRLGSNLALMCARRTAQLHAGVAVVGQSGRGGQWQGHGRELSAFETPLSTQSQRLSGTGCRNPLNCGLMRRAMHIRGTAGAGRLE